MFKPLVLSPQEQLLILLFILRLVFGPTFNLKYVMNMKNYGLLVKYIKPYIPHFNR